jgi:hypothetical protein
MGTLDELKELTTEDSIKGQLATQLHDITEQYNEGILSAEEYKELVEDVNNVSLQNQLANDEVTSRWLVKVTQSLLSVV